MRAWLPAVAALWTLAGPAGAAGPEVREYQLEADFTPEQSRMRGHAVVTFAGTVAEPPIFYLHGELWVDSVRVDGAALPTEQRPVLYESDYSLVATETRVVGWTAPADQLEIWYSGFFHPSKARSLSDYMRLDADGVFLRGYGYSLWFPVFLGPRVQAPPTDFAPVTIRTPADYTSVFVGRRTGERTEGNQRVTTWEARGVSPFAAQCTAQRFTVLTVGDYFLYHRPDSASARAAGSIASIAADVNARFAEHYRRPAGDRQFHLMEMPEYGDISSDNVTGVTHWIWRRFADDENAQRALTHELVHPYAAVPVARSDSLFALVVEGFPSYLHLPILAQRLGDDFYNRFLAWMETRYLELRTRGTDERGSRVPPEKPLLAITADELSIYKDAFVLSDRALLLLNWLYARMGERRFFRFTSDLLNRSSLSTPEFRRVVERHLPHSGDDLRLWLSTTDYPERLHFRHFERGRRH